MASVMQNVIKTYDPDLISPPDYLMPGTSVPGRYYLSEAVAISRQKKWSGVAS